MSLNATIWFQKHLKWTLFWYHFPWLLLKSLFWFALEWRVEARWARDTFLKLSFKRLQLMTRQLAKLHRTWRIRGRIFRENTSIASPICSSVQFSSVAQSCLTLSDPMDCSTPGFPVHHQLPELAQTHVHWVSDAIQPSHLLSSPSPPIIHLPQHQGLFQWVSSHQVAKVLELQLQHQSFQWIVRTNFL